jgi:hypothetical protein
MIKDYIIKPYILRILYQVSILQSLLLLIIINIALTQHNTKSNIAVKFRLSQYRIFVRA